MVSYTREGKTTENPLERLLGKYILIGMLIVYQDVNNLTIM